MNKPPDGPAGGGVVSRCTWTCWGSQCGRETLEGSLCEEHRGRHCLVCKKPADQGCSSYWGPGVCGAPLCSNHTNDCPNHKSGR
jgi:hypothetical protein